MTILGLVRIEAYQIAIGGNGEFGFPEAALTARFGDDIIDLQPEKLDEMINRHKGSVRLQMQGCPLSRVGVMRHRAMADQAAWDAKENGNLELAVLTQNAESDDRESEIPTGDSVPEAASRVSSAQGQTLEH